LSAAARAVVVMGVSGSGKSTVGAALARRLGATYIEGDALHSPSEIARMASGHPLTDEDRLPWLDRVGAAFAAASERGPVVAACSALRRAYRDVLRGYVPSSTFVELDGDAPTIASRMLARPHSFMPVSLLASQFETLEPLGPDEHGVRIDVGALAPEGVLERALQFLGAADTSI
jgi:gluconokinase